MINAFFLQHLWETSHRPHHIRGLTVNVFDDLPDASAEYLDVVDRQQLSGYSNQKLPLLSEYDKSSLGCGRSE